MAETTTADRAIFTTILSSVLPPIVEKAASLLLDQAADQYDIMVDIQRDIRSLKTKLNEVNGILQEAEERQIGNPNVRELLRELVDVGYDARDVLDDFMTAASIRRTSRWVIFDCFPFSFFLRCFNDLQVELPFLRRCQLANGIKSVMKRLDEIMEQRDIVDIRKSLGERGSNSESPSRSRPKTSFYVNRQRNLFVGREDEKDEIIKKLVHHDGNGVLVVPIWGVGGVGKTTLAQSIYNDIERVKEEDYPLICNRKWLFVGEKKFNAQEIIERIIGKSNHPDFVDIQKKLVENFKGNKFLIVLDDVWDLDSNEWKLLFDPLTNVGKGGVIIITTRRIEVISATNTKVQSDLRPLSYEDCWKIFESHAFVDGKSSNKPEMEHIGREIVEKLDGLPLATQVVGSSLLNEPDATWSDFINNWERNLRNKNNKIMEALRWSYKLLPPHLKHCFAYCALFPKDHVFDEKVLVEMWMAHDLIQINGDRRPEDIGTQYFKELTYASLIQCVDERYVMHDMIHDLALQVSNEECSSAFGSLSTDQKKKVRHITITDDDEYSKNFSLCKSRRILTIYTPYTYRLYSSLSPLEKDILLEVFKQSKSLRVLVLCNDGIKEIPECISELKHLRYLDVSETDVKSLPDSLCHLYNLQMLAAPLYAALPRDIVNMVNLRYVRANLSTCKGVGKLTSLQELSSIHVCEGDNIRELADMQLLRGKLRIRGLENVTSSEDAFDALMEKQTLMDELELVFNQSTISAHVLDALRCPPNLKCLKISSYNGLKPPSWMVDGKHKFDKIQKLELYDCSKLESLIPLREFDKLQTLELSFCPKLKSLPPLGELTYLKRLSLWEVGVKRLGDEFYGKFTDSKVFFPSLESLSFDKMNEWEEWDDVIIENSSVSFFPRLASLNLINCPKLESLPPLRGFDKLQTLELSNCPKFKSLPPLRGFDKLRTLELLECPELESLPPLGELKSLKDLSLQNVGVKRLGDEFYGKFSDGKVFFPSLESLRFDDMNEWKEWEDVIIENSSVSFFPRLTSLDIINCPKLQSIPPLRGFDKLQTLELSNCPTFKSLPPLRGFDKLRTLELLECPELEFLPPLGELTSLNDLSLRNVGVKRLGDEFYGKFTDGKVFFPSLESLRFDVMNEWEEWDDVIIENFSVSFFPRLTSLNLIYCPKLESLPPLRGFDNLQTLKLSYCPKFKSLPPLRGFDKLRTLELLKCPELEFLPPLGELTSLKDLSLRNVGINRLGDEFYGKFTDGKVFFPSLESLRFDDMKEWKEWDDVIIENSSVSFFPRLTSLVLTNCPKLESLPPLRGFDKLQTLKLSNCRKFKSLPPLRGFNKLRTLELLECPELESLPAVGELTSLKDLSLRNVGVKRLGDQFYGKFTDRKVFFPSLESLHFDDMNEWKEWDDVIIKNSSVSFFPRLTNLDLINCPKLESLPPLRGFDKLEALEISDCPKFKSLPPLRGFDKLRSLEILGCPELESLPALEELTSLKDLSLRNVGVKRLGDEFYEKFTDSKVFFPSLESLRFDSMNEWKEWDDIIIENSSVSYFPRLTILEIEDCANVVSVLPVVKNPIINAANFMTSLSRLTIWSCDGLKRLQLDVLASLKELMISDCPMLESLPPLGELTSLNDLSLRNLGVKRLGDEFYGKFTDGKVFFQSLESLHFDEMNEWKEWDDVIIKNSSVSFFPRLTSLDLIDCPKLESLPTLRGFDKLQTMKLSNCPKLKSLPQLKGFDKLWMLELLECPELESLPALGELTSLIDLSLRKVGVKRLGDEFYGKFTDGKVFFPSLESLSFFVMDEWEKWNDIIIENSSVSFFPHLKSLDLINCPKLESLPPLRGFDKLQTLKLSICPTFKSLPPLRGFDKLRTLEMLECPELESLSVLGELASLIYLYLRNVGVKRLGDEFYGKFTDGKVFFPSLESLRFEDMNEWKEWDDVIIENSSVSFFPRLTSLDLINCPKLESLPPLRGFDKLQTLELSYCPKFKSLPPLRGFDKLRSLKLLICPELESLPALGELTSLKDLSLWDVGVKRLGDEFYGKFTDGKIFFPSLESLHFDDMNEWKEWDDVFIENSVVSFFPRLTSLVLINCPKLESLPPLRGFDKLQTLKQWNCPKFKSLPPLRVFDNLRMLELLECPKLESLPALGELTSLIYLSLRNVGVKRLGDEFYGKFTDGKVFFPSLESLSFFGMDECEKWDDIIIENSNVSFFPCLTRLELSDWPKLESLPAVGEFDKLKKLELEYFPKLESLPALGELTSLKDLSLRNVGLKRLGDEFYGKFTDGKVFFPSLESLEFYFMEEWEEWDDIIIENSSVSFFPRLTELKIGGCAKLVSILPVVKNPIMNVVNFMTSLSRLEICNCDGLRSLPADGLPPSLTYLEINGCPLLYERCRDESRLDWHKINHIPDKYICP